MSTMSCRQMASLPTKPPMEAMLLLCSHPNPFLLQVCKFNQLNARYDCRKPIDALSNHTSPTETELKMELNEATVTLGGTKEGDMDSI